MIQFIHRHYDFASKGVYYVLRDQNFYHWQVFRGEKQYQHLAGIPAARERVE